MTVRLERPDRIDDLPELEDILREYLGPIARGMDEVLGVPVVLDDMVTATLANLDDYLPPKGVTILARDGRGTLAGTIFLKFHHPDTAEIKRLYVRPAARGTGLGRRLAEEIVETARVRGATRVLLDTAPWLKAAQRLYASLGFAFIDMYPETENDPRVAPRLVFMELRF